MNIFGAFTFGSLIKTFIPGFVWLVALAVLAAGIFRAVSGQSDIWQFAVSHDQTILVLAIPAAFLLGLLSNIVVFMGVNDRLVRRPVRKKYPALFNLYDSLIALYRGQCRDAVGLDDAMKPVFDEYIDVEILILQVVNLDHLTYLREQYWYHLEFQVNLFISSVALSFALFLDSVLNAPVCSMLTTPACPAQDAAVGLSILKWAMVYGVAALLAYALLIPAAKKNFQRHIAKISSLIAAAIAAKAAPPMANGLMPGDNFQT